MAKPSLSLYRWYLKSFSAEEREYIEHRYCPICTSSTPMTMRMALSFEDPYLWAIASWFRRPALSHPLDYSIARRILVKCLEIYPSASEITELHCTYTVMIEIYYRHRNDDPNALQAVITACEDQIAFSERAIQAFKKAYKISHAGQSFPLIHLGFQQLAIIREKQANCPAAIDLSQRAMEQGWRGDWDKRITRCKARIQKEGKIS